ncbi:unnamed protein product [Porites lobata]|uniref:Uncharacterized protein n=1 Tax=Porites lobata TaxID=104759 RepID=A0ABN8R532_9CNID|nr:unnamed protein product [Porites lobata]
MELRGFFATVFAFLFTGDVYSSQPRRFWRFDYAGLGCTNELDRYMRINMGKCENKNSQMECSAMANGDTTINPRTHFTLEKPKKNKPSKMRCISFNNTYSLMVQGNNVSFVNVSCEKGRANVWFKFIKLKKQSGEKNIYYGFFIRNSTMCLTSSCDGTLSVVKVNSTADRKCFFRQYHFWKRW